MRLWLYDCTWHAAELLCIIIIIKLLYKYNDVFLLQIKLHSYSGKYFDCVFAPLDLQ